MSINPATGMANPEMKSWLALTYSEAARSPDPSTQIGTLLVNRFDSPCLSTLAHNGPPEGWTLQPEDLERPRKYQIFEHAERKALYKAARLGLQTEHCTMVATWAACADCARGIVEAGIRKLIRHYPPLDDAVERWLESISLGDQILKAGGVQIIDVVSFIPDAPSILRDGAPFDPAGIR